MFTHESGSFKKTYYFMIQDFKMTWGHVLLFCDYFDKDFVELENAKEEIGISHKFVHEIIIMYFKQLTNTVDKNTEAWQYNFYKIDS